MSFLSNNSKPPQTSSAPEPEVFFGEAELGAGRSRGKRRAVAEDADAKAAQYKDEETGGYVGEDGEPVSEAVGKALISRSMGEKLGNKARQALKAYEADREFRATSKAGYGAGGKKADKDDEYGLAGFSLSQAGADSSALTSAAENSKDIVIEKFTLTAHKKELFKDASLRIAHGKRYGLVGPNGQGKTTLLKHIAARELAIPPRISILYVEQEVIADETPAVQAVLKADKERAKLVTRETELLELLRKADEAEASGSCKNREQRDALDEELGEVYDRMASMKADSSEASARKILSGLGFSLDMQDRPTRQFLGGWRMRISLARALFMEPDLLLLDEPTNHLDLEAVIWLQEYLSKWKTTLLIVSHDQEFLSSVVTDIIHLEDCKLHYYRGDYDSFKEQHALDMEKRLKDYEKQQKLLRSMKDKGKTSNEAKAKAIARAKREGAATGKAAKSGGAGTRDDDCGIPEQKLLTKPHEYKVEFTFSNPDPLPPPILSVHKSSFRYGEKYPWLFEDIDFGIDQSSRVAIVGPNGVGKSTLLAMMIGELEPTTGEVQRNRFLRVGKYSQHFVDILPMQKSPVDYLRGGHPDLKEQEARALLGRFGLEGHAHTIAIKDLSGGQKARVVFADLCLQRPHIMVLDEPTNNLDIESIDALGDALSNFTGGVVLVSHDARLIRNVKCHLWVCNNRKVLPHEGGYDDYKEETLARFCAEEAALDIRFNNDLAKAIAEEAKKVEDAKNAAILEKVRALRAAAAAAAAKA